MSGVITKFAVTSMVMWIAPVAIVYGFYYQMIPGVSQLSPSTQTLVSGFLAVISVNLVIGFYICMAMKETPHQEPQPDPAFLANAKASISQPTSSQVTDDSKGKGKVELKAVCSAANRAKLQAIVVEKEAMEDQIIGQGIDGIEKEREAVRSKILVLEDELKAVDAEIASLQEDFNAATTRKDKAFEALIELRQARDANNATFHQNRAVLNKARDYAKRNNVNELHELHNAEVDKFMAQWCGSKAFREDYERRALSSLDIRQLNRDGRIRNP